MTDLTEQWKKGELPEGVYYYILIKQKIIPAKLSRYNNFYLTEGACGNNGIKPTEVLAPVPSYDEYMTMKDCAKAVFEAAQRETKLKEELSREVYKTSEAYCLVEELKELLKECESSIQYYQETYGAMDLDTYTLLAKLKEALK